MSRDHKRDRHREPDVNQSRPPKGDPRSVARWYEARMTTAEHDFERENFRQHADHWNRVARGVS